MSFLHCALIAAPGQVKTRWMDIGAKPGLADEFAAALDWWREAGVDCDYADDPQDWLAKSPPPPEVEAPAPVAAPAKPVRAAPPKPAIDLAAMPGTLPEFVAWWLGEPALDHGRTSGRAPPRGPAGAALMVLVEEPEREDTDRLLSGPQGKLLDSFLAAAGIAPDAVYVASALVRRTPMADWREVAAAGLGEALKRHVALVAPARLLALGGNVLSLLGHDPAQDPAVSRQFDHEGAAIPLVRARSLQAMLGRPAWKAALWREWLDATA